MIPNDVNQRNKILGLTPQQLINPEQRGLRNKFLSWLLKDVNVNVLNVKHLDVYGKNTLTTPKIVITDSGTNPANDGEITRNGAIIKAKTGGVVINIGRSLALDEIGETIPVFTGTVLNSRSIFREYFAQDVWTDLESTTITVDDNDSIVVLIGGWVFWSNSSSDYTGDCRLMEGAVQKGSTVSASTGASNAGKALQLIEAVVLTGVSSGSHTYKVQGRHNGVNGENHHGSLAQFITATAIKLV